MKVAVVIAEYNPFHLGHEYQLRALREALGELAVVAVMGDCFTQRGDPALFPAPVRARAALSGGADLVLSLPFPYCAGGGGYFAQAGARIAAALFPGAYLAFGSESGELEALSAAAGRLGEADFSEELAARPAGEPQAAAAARIYAARFGDEQAALLRRPNNILALEYLAAIRREELPLVPFTVRREGGDYASTETATEYPSATALRAALSHGKTAAFYRGVPTAAGNVYETALRREEFSRGWEALSPALLSFFRLTPPETLSGAAEMTGGLERRLVAAAADAGDAAHFFSLSATKRFTNARIRRAALSAMLGVTEEDLASTPDRVRLLGANARGLAALRGAAQGTVGIVTKPSDYAAPGRMNELCCRAEALYDLSLARPRGARAFMRRSPVILEP